MATGGMVPRMELAKKSARTSPGPPSPHHGTKTRSSPDVTIKYGADDAHCFDGHRLVLSNSSEWFQLSSNQGFIETDAPITTLKDDFPEALDALFEFYYLGKYTDTC
jgi:hypothetical protein